MHACGASKEVQHTGGDYATGTANKQRKTESRIPEIIPIFLDPIDHDAVHRTRERVFLFLLLTVRRRIDEAVLAEGRGRS